LSIEGGAAARAAKAGSGSVVIKDESGPATLGTTAKAHLLLRVWCKDCQHQIDIDPASRPSTTAPISRCPIGRAVSPTRIAAVGGLISSSRRGAPAGSGDRIKLVGSDPPPITRRRQQTKMLVGIALWGRQVERQKQQSTGRLGLPPQAAPANGRFTRQRPSPDSAHVMENQ
jgi:hypothetical protein